MRVVVKHEQCQGHARCMATAPAIYELDDSGYILPGTIEIVAGMEQQALRGARACPEQALVVEEDGIRTWPRK